MVRKHSERKLVQRSEQRVKKIVWPDKMTVAKETAAVVSVSVVLGAIIALVDFFAQYGVDLLIK